MSLMVIIGWYTNNIHLVQINPSFAPMQFNTALAFLLCGGILITVSKNKNTPALFMSLTTLLISVLTLCQYIFNVNFGIDELLMEHSIVTKTSHVGRMAPNTALSFILSSIAVLSFLLLNNKYASKTVVLFGAMVFSLGTVALIGYVGDIDPAYGWGNFTRMAFHTSVGFLIMGYGIIILVWLKSSDDTKSDIPNWLYLIVAVISLTITISVWQALHQYEINQYKNRITQVKEHLNSYIVSNIDSQLLALQRLADRWKHSKGTSRDLWEKDALAYYYDYDVFQAIEWVDAYSYIRWVVPLEGNENIINMHVAFSEARIAALNYARINNQPAISDFIELKQTNKNGFLVYLPLYFDNHFDGYITAVYEVDKLFNKLLFDYIKKDYKFYIKHNSQIYFFSPSGQVLDDTQVTNIDIEINNINWQLSMVPPAFSSSLTPLIVLTSGILFSILLSVAIRLVERAQHDKKRIEAFTKVLSDYADEIQLSKFELQSILDNAVDAIISIDEKGIIQTVNYAGEIMFGYEKNEMIGNNVKILMPEPYHREHDEFLKNYLKTGIKKIIGQESREVTGIKKDGSIIPIEITVSESIIKKNHIYTGFIRDISERKEASNKLSSQKQYYESLIHNLNVPAFILDPEHKVLIWNKACEQMTGVLAEEVIGTSDHWCGFYNEKRPVLADIIIDQSFEQIKEYYEIELENSFIKGGRQIENWCPMPRKKKPIYLAIDAGPVFNDAGELVVVIQVVKDITKLKKIQDTLKIRQTELERSNIELQQFAYVASHDLQEPLRMVSSFTQLLADRYKDKLDEQANEFIGFAVDGAKRMQVLIQDLLLLSKVDKKNTPFEACDANKLFKTAIQNLQISIEETKTEVSYDELPEIYGDEVQLIQLLQNLIGNAVKYRDPDKKNKVHISAKRIDKNWVFSVKDNGIGIEESYYEKIFIIFKRLHTKHEYSGTGIGLALCKKIVERHGGEIWLESTPGDGTTFYFSLPEDNIFPDNKNIEEIT